MTPSGVAEQLRLKQVRGDSGAVDREEGAGAPAVLVHAVSFSPRPVQKHKRTQDWRAGLFRSSSPRGEPQIWGVSEAMSAIRVLRTRRENTVQQRDATLPGGDLDPGPGRTWTRTC